MDEYLILWFPSNTCDLILHLFKLWGMKLTLNLLEWRYYPTTVTITSATFPCGKLNLGEVMTVTLSRGCMLQCPSSSSVGASERAGNSLKNPPRTLRKMTASCCQKRDCGSKLLLSPRRSAIRCFHFCFPDAMHLRSRKRDPVPLCPCYVLWWQRRCNVRRFRMCLLWAEELPKAQPVNTAENWI